MVDTGMLKGTVARQRVISIGAVETMLGLVDVSVSSSGLASILPGLQVLSILRTSAGEAPNDLE